jgi:hypothetical protein
MPFISAGRPGCSPWPACPPFAERSGRGARFGADPDDRSRERAIVRVRPGNRGAGRRPRPPAIAVPSPGIVVGTGAIGSASEGDKDAAGLDVRPDLHVLTSFVMGSGRGNLSGANGSASIAENDAARLDVGLDLHRTIPFRNEYGPPPAPAPRQSRRGGPGRPGRETETTGHPDHMALGHYRSDVGRPDPARHVIHALG